MKMILFSRFLMELKIVILPKSLEARQKNTQVSSTVDKGSSKSSTKTARLQNQEHR